MSATPLQERIGRAIRRRREAMKISQDDFADRIEMHRSYYGFLERGQKDMQMSTLERVCKGLGARMSEIISEAELMK